VKPETAWQSGRLHSRSGPHRLLFGRMYEDVEIERAAFEGKRRVFCIASAGDTAFTLAETHEVIACDINPTQLAYAQQRAEGAPQETGDAERAMNFARTFMPLIGWRKERLRKFLSLSDVTQQMNFWQEHLNTRRLRAAFDTLMSPAILRAVYQSQLLTVLPPKFGSVLRNRMERTFANHPNATNPYAKALLLGESETEPVSKSSNIRFVQSDAASYLESCDAHSFDAFTLSNILDGAEPSYRTRLIQAIRHAATEDAVVVLRSFAEPSPNLATNHAHQDRSILWGVVETRKALDF
jgi:S-adenosylmethionine:diacylglycerol 3-amino-3-carboxypropyl transferase